MPITTPKVPDGLPELMRGLAKSVIKENPENIYVHAAEYFENLIRERDGGLDRGYQNFSAYKVYADYKEKCRGKGGGNESLSGGEIPSSAGGVAVRSRMASDGDDDSGGSASATRGRRKKRVRKQGSKESNKSLEKQESIGSITENGGEEEKKPTSADGSLQESLIPIKEDTPDIEEAVVKVQAHLECQAPRERPFNKSVSVDSVAAASAVSSVLQDAGEEADDADRETGEAIETQVEADLAAELGHPINCEDVDSYPPDETEDDPEAGNGEDYGSAPSTAEVGGEVIGDAEVLVNDAPPNGSDQVVVIESSQKNSDEVDLSVDDVANNNEEPLANGSVEEQIDGAAEASVEKQDSAEVQIEGVDTVDESVPVVEEVDESVPNLPDVPTEEPNIEEVESGDTEEVQAEPIVDEPNEQKPVDDETKEDIVEDANVIKSSKESSVDKVDEASAADDATKDGKVKSDAIEDGAEGQEVPSNKADSIEEVSPKEVNENGSASPPLVKSESKDNETVGVASSPKQIRSVEDDTNGNPSGEGPVDKAVEEVAEESSPVAVEGPEDEQADPSEAQPENVNGNESGGSLDNPPENGAPVDNVPEEVEVSASKNPEATKSNGKSGEATPLKSESVEQIDAQSAGEDIPSESAENVESNDAPGSEATAQPEDGVQENSNGSGEEKGKASKEPSLDKPESEKGESADEPKSSGSAAASREPSVDKVESEKEGSADEPKSSGSAKASNEPSLDKPESEKNGSQEEPKSDKPESEKDVSADEPKSNGSAQASKEPSLDKPKSESVDEPKSGGSAKSSKEPSLDKPESEKNMSADEVKSGGSAKSSKDPSLDKPKSENNESAIEPKSSGSAKASKEPSQDNPDSDKNGNMDEPKANGSAKASQETSLDKPNSEKDDGSVEEPKSSGSAKASKEPSLEQAEPDLKSDGSAKVPSLDKTESELDQSNGDQSKESSAKESAGESGSVEAVTAPDEGGSADAGEMSMSSRMGDDEQEPESEAVDEPSAPPMEDEETGETGGEDKVKSDELKTEDDSAKNDGNGEETTADQVNQGDDEETDESKEEVVEEPCIQRQVSPSASKIPSKQPSVELDDIKKVDLASFNKDSAEALFYTLKKSELENQESQATKPEAKVENGVEENEDDDDDVVVTEEPPSRVSRVSPKRSFTDNFLESSPITDEVSKSAEGDGVADQDGVEEDENQQFNPMFAASVRNKQLQDQLHSRFSQDDTSKLDNSTRRAAMHRSMTERMDLARQDTNYVDLRKYDPDYVEEEDQFDGYYIGNLKHKILASSVSVADSDYYDQEQAEGSMDDNNVQTALETIASTDTESTLPSQTTIQANRGFLKRGSQNTSSNIPYASFGNNAINQSLDDFIEREEQMKEAEAQAASTIQRSYRRFRTNKKKLLRDYHSTMQTFTEDQSTESLEDYPSSVIQIKLDRKQPEESDNSFEDARSENRRRPMYSLNIDEYDTAARRMTLTRGVAMQRNSTPEEDSGKSDNASGEKKSASEPASNLAITEGTPRTSSDLSSEEKKSSTSSDEKENKDNSSSKSS
ncbi:microtubule-associated protein futsch isoform X2 [Aedes albopictus]